MPPRAMGCDRLPLTRESGLNPGTFQRPARRLAPLACLWVALGVCHGTAAADSAQTSFEAGIRAYRAGDFSTALELFRQARAQGTASDALLFNLGLTYYQLKDYTAARRTFLELRERPAMAAIAEYHLGLVAAQLGQTDRAAAHLRAASAGGSEELRRLAQIALGRLTRPTPTRALAAYASVGVGYDTNRNQISETIRIAGPEPESVYGELTGVVLYPLPWIADTDLRGTVFRRDYEEDDALDQTAVQLTLRRAWRASPWRVTVAAESDAAFLDGDSLLNGYGLNIEAARRLGSSTVWLRYRPTLVAGGSDYDYLDGSRHRADLTQQFVVGDYQLRLGYEAETNDREDLRAGQEFFSQSPVRHGPFLRLSRALTVDLALDLNAAYRHSRYRDENRYLQDGALRTERRVENLTFLSLVMRLRLGTTWGLRLDYRYTDNRSSVDTYDYGRDVALLALEWRY